MSYEGYTEYLCAKGHYWNADCYADAGDCPECGGVYIWRGQVDLTNGTDYETGEGVSRLDTGELIIKTRAVCETCPACGIERTVSPATYHIPGQKPGKE